MTTVLLESRTQALNRSDLTMVAALRTTGAIKLRLEVEFELPEAEPMLWVADTVAGAIAATYNDPGAYATLCEQVTAHHLDVS